MSDTNGFIKSAGFLVEGYTNDNVLIFFSFDKILPPDWMLIMHTISVFSNNRHYIWFNVYFPHIDGFQSDIYENTRSTVIGLPMTIICRSKLKNKYLKVQITLFHNLMWRHFLLTMAWLIAILCLKRNKNSVMITTYSRKFFTIFQHQLSTWISNQPATPTVLIVGITDITTELENHISIN